MILSQEKGCFLAGDIGGTKTTLALYDSRQEHLSPLAQTTVQNETAAGLEDIIDVFLGQQKIKPDFACFGVAGPVVGNRVRMTNLDWILEGEALQRQFGMQSVILINDLVATAIGAVNLSESGRRCINPGRPNAEGAIAVIAPGTGLGQAFLVRHNDRLLPFPSEGGHCSFAPADSRQVKLLEYMLARQDHVSTEDVCSGTGIPRLYDFLLSRPADGRNNSAGLPADGDRTKSIVQGALTEKEKPGSGDRIAAEAVELFVAILASEAENLALKVLSTGGLFIAGGLPPRILPYLESEMFMRRFCIGIYRDLLADIPVQVVLEPETALNGAAAYALTIREEK